MNRVLEFVAELARIHGVGGSVRAGPVHIMPVNLRALCLFLYLAVRFRCFRLEGFGWAKSLVLRCVVATFLCPYWDVSGVNKKQCLCLCVVYDIAHCRTIHPMMSTL